MNRVMSLTAICGVVIFTPALAQGPMRTPAGKSDAVSDSERLKRAADAVHAMRASLGQVSSRVEDARNEKDVVKLNCVNEKLAQIKGLLKVAEQSETALKVAVANGDPSGNTEFAKIGIARTKIDVLGNEAQQCIGQLAYIVDEKTTVEVQQPVGQPEPDTSGRYRPAPPPAGPVVLRPPNASPF